MVPPHLRHLPRRRQDAQVEFAPGACEERLYQGIPLQGRLVLGQLFGALLRQEDGFFDEFFGEALAIHKEFLTDDFFNRDIAFQIRTDPNRPLGAV